MSTTAPAPLPAHPGIGGGPPRRAARLSAICRAAGVDAAPARSVLAAGSPPREVLVQVCGAALPGRAAWRLAVNPKDVTPCLRRVAPAPLEASANGGSRAAGGAEARSLPTGSDLLQRLS